MATRYVCDYCGAPATYRIVAIPIRGEKPITPDGRWPGLDTCDDHYEFTHPGKAGGGWWDDFSAPQESGKRRRDLPDPTTEAVA